MGAEHPDSVEILFANRTSVMNRRSGGDQADIVPRGGIAERHREQAGELPPSRVPRPIGLFG